VLRAAVRREDACRPARDLAAVDRELRDELIALSCRSARSASAHVCQYVVATMSTASSTSATTASAGAACSRRNRLSRSLGLEISISPRHEE
jgi:hypothetical protein